MEVGYRSDPVVTLGPSKKHCFACSGVLDMRAELCPRCGVRQPMMANMHPPMGTMGSAVMAVPQTSKSKISAALLALFFGGLGFHKFYLGQTAAGVLYLLFCWTFIPALIALVEGIAFLTMSEDTFARRHPG